MVKAKSKGGGQAIENATRGTIFHVPVEDLKTYPAWHPRYDARSEYKPAPEMIANVRARGVQKPLRVEVHKVDVIIGEETLEAGIYVVDGHQRRAWALGAKESLEKDGEPADFKVPVWPVKGDDDYLATLSVALNRHVPDDPTVIAGKLRSIADRCGGDIDAVAVQTGYTKSFVKQHLALLDLSKGVQKMVAKGELSVSTAATVAKMPKEEQETAVEKAKASAPEGDGRRKTTVTARAVKNAGGPTRPGVKEIKTRLVELEAVANKPGSIAETVTNALLEEYRWITTGVR